MLLENYALCVVNNHDQQHIRYFLEGCYLTKAEFLIYIMGSDCKRWQELDILFQLGLYICPIALTVLMYIIHNFRLFVKFFS